MLRSMHDLEDYAIRATDGAIGQVKDFYFDDEAWVIRYLIVETGTWLASRKVLISPIAIGLPNWTDRVLPVSITKAQVQNSPGIDTDIPISRQLELQYLGYFGYPYYWGGSGLWGGGAYPGMMMPGYAGFISIPAADLTEAEQAYAQAEAVLHQDDDPHLRSCKSVINYHIQATDGDIGHVAGLLVDEETWAVRYMIVDTSNWWLDHQVLIAPQWIRDVNWFDATVAVNLTRQLVQDAPLYNSSVQLDRKQEANIYKHYGHPGYWVAEVKSETVISRHSKGRTVMIAEHDESLR